MTSGESNNLRGIIDAPEEASPRSVFSLDAWACARPPASASIVFGAMIIKSHPYSLAGEGMAYDVWSHNFVRLRYGCVSHFLDLGAQDQKEHNTLESLRVFVQRLDDQVELLRKQVRHYS